MSKFKSLFGAYSDRLQVVVDNSKDKFAPTWYQNYFSFAPPQQSLTYVQAIGRSRIEAAASIVSRDGQTPLRSRDKLEKLSGEIPAIKEAFKMSETDVREFMMLNQTNVDDNIKKNAILDYLFNDTKKVGDSAMKRLDILCLQAVSEGKISVNTTNNPDGLVLATDIDLLMPSTNKTQAATTWANTSATPITDIETVVVNASSRGLAFEKILISFDLWLKFKKTAEVIDTMKGYFYAGKLGNGYNPTAITTLDRINEYMQANRLPVIEIVDATIGVEKDGVISTIKPFNANNASFIPSGNLGTIKNAIAIEQMRPVDNVSYATYNRALISKWSENEPFGEWTKVELNAFPAFEAIDSCHILTAVFS